MGARLGNAGGRVALLALAACPQRERSARSEATDADATGRARGSSTLLTVPPEPTGGCPATDATARATPGTVHASVLIGNETWTSEGSPHRTPRGLWLGPGSSLTLAPCALLLAPRAGAIVVQRGAALFAIGEPRRPVVIDGDGASPQPGSWPGIRFESGARPSSRLIWLQVRHAGGTEPDAAALRVRGFALDAEHLVVSRARGLAIALEPGGRFASSAGPIEVRGTVASALRTGAPLEIADSASVATVPEMRFTENASDRVLLGGNGAVGEDATWRATSLPYVLRRGASVVVQGPADPLLTLAPGVRILFEANAALVVGRDLPGALRAEGGDGRARIELRSARAQPAAGDWRGLWLGPAFDVERTRIDGLTIADAGASWPRGACGWRSGDPSKSLIQISREPRAAMLTHVRFIDAPADGSAIARAWSGATLDFSNAILANDFALAGTRCRQSPLSSPRGCLRLARCEGVEPAPTRGHGRR